jgi:hypothetical protein
MGAIDSQERGIGDIREQLHARPRAGIGINPVDGDPLTPPLAIRRRVATNIDEHRREHTDARRVRQGSSFSSVVSRAAVMHPIVGGEQERKHWLYGFLPSPSLYKTNYVMIYG